MKLGRSWVCFVRAHHHWNPVCNNWSSKILKLIIARTGDTHTQKRPDFLGPWTAGESCGRQTLFWCTLVFRARVLASHMLSCCSTELSLHKQLWVGLKALQFIMLYEMMLKVCKWELNPAQCRLPGNLPSRRFWNPSPLITPYRLRTVQSGCCLLLFSLAWAHPGSLAVAPVASAGTIFWSAMKDSWGWSVSMCSDWVIGWDCSSRMSGWGREWGGG